MPTYYAIGKPVAVRHISGTFYPLFISNRQLTAQQVLKEGFSQTYRVRVFTKPEDAKEHALTQQVRTPSFGEYVLQDPPILVIETIEPLKIRKTRLREMYYEGDVIQDSQKIEKCSVEFASRPSTILAVDIPKRTMGCVVA